MIEKNTHYAIKQYLSKTDLIIDSAYCGKEALNKIIQETYDLLITDFNMPDINAFQLIDKL
ncbi:MAG: response regulator [bacterium]|nr:response regulator [bacterium]